MTKLTKTMNTTDNTLWSQTAWHTALPVYDAILDLPFLKELAAGTLPRDKFEFYIGQDSLYLNDYTRMLSHIAARMDKTELTERFLRFALDGIAVERELHASFISSAPKEKSPTCLFYTSLLKSTAMEETAVECAAVLPCFWIYREVGKEIIRRAKMEGNPYAHWISTYADETFDQSTDAAIAICDMLAAESSQKTRDRMTEIFLNASRLELRFWDSAYHLEKWEL